MSQVVPAFLGTTVRTEILGLAYGTCWDVPSSPELVGIIGQSMGIPDIMNVPYHVNHE